MIFMNKQLISEVIVSGHIRRRWTEEFFPQDVKIKYFNCFGDEAEKGDEVNCYMFNVEAPGIDSLNVRKVTLPTLDYSKNSLALITIEYDQFIWGDGCMSNKRFHKGDIVKVTKDIPLDFRNFDHRSYLIKIREGMMGLVKRDTEMEYLGGDDNPIVEFDFNPYISISFQINSEYVEKVISEENGYPNGFEPYDGLLQ
jgi:hypothetical protein